MTPEEKMANRVLPLWNLKPPFDIDALARKYGSLEYLELPYRVDGITVGIGGINKPQILINASLPATRKKFTLAHEIGHIIIPWHTGTIISHLDLDEADSAYRQMEAEANRFAAELLMPTEWLREEFERANSMEHYFLNILSHIGASKEATFYKIFCALASPVVCVQVDSDLRPISIQRSPSAPYLPAKSQPLGHDTFKTDHQFEKFEIDGQYYVSWLFKSKAIQEMDTRPWREVFSDILDDTGMRTYLQNINAILAAAFNKNKDFCEPEICGAIIRTFADREEYQVFFEHPLFEQYVIKRVKEMKRRS